MHRSAALLALFLLGRFLSAQLPVAPAPKAPDATKPVEQDPFGRDTPRGCVLGFLKASERGDYAQAAQYLDTRAAASEAQEQTKFISCSSKSRRQ